MQVVNLHEFLHKKQVDTLKEKNVILMNIKPVANLSDWFEADIPQTGMSEFWLNKSKKPFKRSIMKVGSLVECINTESMEGLAPLKKNTFYTIRQGPVKLEGRGCLQIWLEEIINGNDRIGEKAYGAFRFREVQPPMDLSFVQELQNNVYA